MSVARRTLARHCTASAVCMEVVSHCARAGHGEFLPVDYAALVHHFPPSPPMNRLSVPAKKSPPPSRFAKLLDFVIRHAGSVAVDHTHLLPLDRVSGRTGAITPTSTHRRCY